ncbi:MAG: hypothetical protein M1840_006179 [Geoglossum simile]|nr:MAG: hypothetical protein M1840_006179 [Geoglossum simile]
MSATETAKYHGLELSAESSDAVNGGSTEEAATSLNIESTRDTRVFFVSSKRHTISPPLYLNSPVGPVEHTSRSPSSITEPRTSLFKRLKNKIFRRRSQQRNVPASPQPKAKPVVSRARQVIRRASSMNLFTARQRSQTEPASSAVLAHLPTHRARHHRHLSPLRSETPVDVESLLAFGGKIRQRSSHVSNLKADTDAEEPGPPTKSSPEQFNRRRNRMTVVAGDQTYVDGRIGQPLEWKWSGEDGDAEDGDAEDGGDGWQADGYDAPRSVVGGYPEASVQVTAQAFTQLTCPAPSREEATTSQVYEAEGQPAHSSNSLRPDSMTSGDRGEGFVEDDERDFLRLPEDSEDGQLEEQEVMGADTAVQINATSTNDHPAIVDTPITEDAPATADALAASTTDESSTAATGAGLGEVVQAQPATVGLEGSCIKLVAEASSPATTTIHTQSTPRLKMPVYRDAPFCAQNPSSSTTERENASPEFQLTSIDFDQERLATQKENQKIE